jgi:transposase
MSCGFPNHVWGVRNIRLIIVSGQEAHALPPVGRQSKRWWLTRPDPFEAVWAEIRTALECDPALQATSIFQDIQRRFPARFPSGQLRTLQRKVSNWRRETGACARSERWTLRLLQGKIDEGEFRPLFSSELSAQDVSLLLDSIRNGSIRCRNRAVAVLANSNGVPIPIICNILQAEHQTVRGYIQKFREGGASALIDFSRDMVKKADRKDYRDSLFSILHEPPSLHGINRTRWEMEDLQHVMTQKGFSISLANIRQIIRNAGYKFRKARKVLMSTDPEYREKLQRITGILSRLRPDERFFSVDEFGPFSVRIMGGRSLMPPGQRRSIPQYQKGKGTLIVTAALELSTNQLTHFYSKTKNTAEMIRLLDLLFKQCAGERTLYFSWDAASWHASKELEQHVADLNAVSPSGVPHHPQVELVPLPACAQFLNVIESVFSGMARAILHNSDYESVDTCMEAIDQYFAERNLHFSENPRRAGKKIWGDELVKPAFHPSNNCKDPRWQRE